VTTVAGAGVEDAPVPDVAHLVRVVAIDGPAGSGKSAVARLTAQALGWRFVDTGATYRAVTLHVLRSGVPLDDAAAVAAAAAHARVHLDVDPQSSRVELEGDDVSSEIRGPAVTAAVSAVSAVPAVRARLVLLQRQLMGTSGAVVEGRDIATVVAPQARLKVYLDAREDVRARRRAGDAENGLVQAMSVVSTAADEGGHGEGAVGHAALGAVQADLRRRDMIDSQTNKLEASQGAVHLDTSDMTLAEVVDAVVELVRAAGLAPDLEEGR
jgi:cytidylate kinase